MNGRYNGLWILLYGGCFLGIAVLSLDSNPPQVDLGVLSWDKFEHAAAYALLTFLGVMAFRPMGRSPLFITLGAFAVSVLLGAALEVGQGTLTVTRSADPWDLLADAAGAAVGMAAAVPFISRTSRLQAR